MLMCNPQPINVHGFPKEDYLSLLKLLLGLPLTKTIGVSLLLMLKSNVNMLS
jgi:hypothetical protein